MAEVIFLDGGYGFPGNQSVRYALKNYPEQREELIKELKEADPKKWDQFNQIYPGFVEKLRKKDP
jgi:hypothetical protein